MARRIPTFSKWSPLFCQKSVVVAAAQEKLVLYLYTIFVICTSEGLGQGAYNLYILLMILRYAG